MAAKLRLTHPLPGALETDPFGPRGVVPGYGDLGYHTGQDWAAPAGTPIYSAIDGVVTRKWFDRFNNGNPAGGNMVAIQGQGVEIRYAHMLHPSPLLIGARVIAGRTIIGLVGSTGAATGPHLHFELLVNGRYVDPLPHIGSVPEPEPEPTKEEEEEEEEIMAIYLEATANSSPIKPGDAGTSRIWAGDRVINGARYSGVWERSEDGSIRRLFAAEWAAFQAAYKAAGRKIPLAKVHGNAIEQMYLAARTEPKP